MTDLKACPCIIMFLNHCIKHVGSIEPGNIDCGGLLALSLEKILIEHTLVHVKINGKSLTCERVF